MIEHMKSLSRLHTLSLRVLTYVWEELHLPTEGSENWTKEDYIQNILTYANTSGDIHYVLSCVKRYVLERYEFNEFHDDDHVEWKDGTLQYTFRIHGCYKAHGDMFSFRFTYRDETSEEASVFQHTLDEYPVEDHGALIWYVFEIANYSYTYQAIHSLKNRGTFFSFFKSYNETKKHRFTYLSCTERFPNAYDVAISLFNVPDLHFRILVDVEKKEISQIKTLLPEENRLIGGISHVLNEEELVQFLFEEAPCRLLFIMQ